MYTQPQQPAEMMRQEDEFTIKLPSAVCGEVGEPLPRALELLLWHMVDFCYAPIYWGDNTGPTGTTELTFSRYPTRAEAAAALQFFITHDGS